MNLEKEYWFANHIFKKESKIHNFGLWISQPVKKGELLIKAGGLALHPDQLIDYFGDDLYSYLPIPDSELVLALKTSEPFRATLLNHSCSPNLLFEFPSWRALCDLSAHTELTCDYRTLGYPQKMIQKTLDHCLCQSENCVRL